MRRMLASSGLCAIGLLVLTLPVAAQKKYTNADLAKFRLEGAYTNADLKRLGPAPAQSAPLFRYPEVDLLGDLARREAAVAEAREPLLRQRYLLQAELEYEWDRIRTAYSARGGRAPSARDGRILPLPGLLGKLKPRLEYLEREIALLDREIALVVW